MAVAPWRCTWTDAAETVLWQSVHSAVPTAFATVTLVSAEVTLVGAPEFADFLWHIEHGVDA